MIIQQPHLLVVDGMALLFRSYFATAVRGHFMKTQAGVPTNAVQGFARHTLSAIEQFAPTHVVICWDMGAKTFRNELYPEYKAHRPEPAPELVPQFNLARALAQELGWAVSGKAGIEADDFIGSYAKAYAENCRITIVSGDKDLLQVLRPNVSIAFVKKGYTEYDTYTEQRFIEEYGITPSQFIDVKAFTGDASDGYPGVTGIGPKIATQYIRTYGSVAGVLENLEKLTPARRKRIEEERQNLLVSYELAALADEQEVLSLATCERPIYTQETQERLRELEYALVAKALPLQKAVGR